MQVTIFQPGLLNCSELLAPHGSCYIWSSWNITAKLVSFAAFFGGETSVSLFFFFISTEVPRTQFHYFAFKCSQARCVEGAV